MYPRAKYFIRRPLMDKPPLADFDHEDAELNDDDQDFLDMLDDLQGGGDDSEVPEADSYYEMEDDDEDD